MKFRKTLLTLFALCLFLTEVTSQSMKPSEVDSLQYRICQFLDDSSPRIDTVSAEIILVILSIDQKGEVSAINLLADDKNKQELYRLLSKMPVDTFRGFKLSGLKPGMVTIPVYADGKNAGVNYLISGPWSWVTPSGLNGKVVSKMDFSFLTSGIHYLHNSPIVDPPVKLSRN